MAKRWAISREVRSYGRTADDFIGCYDTKEDAMSNAAEYSLKNNLCEVTVFEAIEIVKASIPYDTIPITTEAVEP